METNCSIVDVARVAGVGIGTVSRVLNHAPNVHPDTALLVHAAVAKLGYRLPARASRRGPRTQRQPGSARLGHEILLVILGPQGLDWILQCAPVFAGVLHGIEGAVADKGHQLSMKQAGSWEQLAKNIGSNPPAGLIVLGFEAGIGKRNDLSTALQQLPTVWTMGSPLDFRGDHLQPDHMKIGSLAAEHLLRQNRRRCALLGAKLGSPAHLMGFRNNSFQWTIEQGGGEVEMLLSPGLIRIAPGLHEVDGNAIASLMARFLKISPRPQALFLEADILAPSVYQHLRLAGIKPQEDIEIVTCNNERPYLAPLDPKPTIIDIQPQVIGRRAVDQLLWRAANRHAPAMRLMVEPVLVAGSTFAGATTAPEP